MRKRSAKEWLAISLTAFPIFMVPGAARGGNLMVGGAGLISRPSDGTDTYFSELGYGAGLFYDDELTPGLRWEVDALYLKRRFGAGAGTNTYEFSQGFLEIPVLVRFPMFDVWSFGAGLYLSPYLSNLNVSTNAGSFTGATPASFDYGIVGSARAGGNRWLPIFMEYRYAWGLSNIEYQGSANYFEIQFFVGLCLGKAKGGGKWCY